MTNQTNATPRTRLLTRSLLLSAGCAGMLWLAGCGRDADEASVTQAGMRLASMDAGSGTPSFEGAAAETYNEVIGDLQSIASGDGPLAADAAVLVSEAQQGLAVHDAERAIEFMQSAMLKHSSIRAQLRAWQMHQAHAAAAASYDASPEIAELDRGTRARQDAAEAERTRKAEIESEIADLLGQVTDRLSRASGLRAQAGTLRLEIARVSETEGLELTKQIRELTRAADKLEFEARQIKVEADRLDLDLRASEVEIAKLTNQIELLGQSKAAVQARATASEAQAARERADAQKAAGELAARIDTGENALTPFMDSQIAPAMQKAASSFQTAITTARKAASTRKSAAQLAIGQAQQNLADVQWTYALHLDSYAQLMEELASADPALPSAAEYASRGQAARQQASDAKQAAYDAYQAALSAYNATGAKGEARDKLQAVSDSLNAVSRAVGDGVVPADELNQLDPAEEEATEPDSPNETTEPAPAAADTSGEFRDALAAVLDAVRNGRVAEVESFVVPATEADRAMFDLVKPATLASLRLDHATRTAFGESFFDWAGNDPMLASFSDPMGFDPAAVNIDDLDIRVQGDEAVILTGNAEVPQLNFRREGGSWKLAADMGAMTDGEGEAAAAMLESMAPLIRAFGDLFGQAAENVESGELGSNAEIGAWIKSQATQIMMQMQQEQSGG